MIHEIATSDFFIVCSGIASIVGLLLTLFISNKVIKIQTNNIELKNKIVEIHGDNSEINKKIDQLSQQNTNGDNTVTL